MVTEHENKLAEAIIDNIEQLKQISQQKCRRLSKENPAKIHAIQNQAGLVLNSLHTSIGHLEIAMKYAERKI